MTLSITTLCIECYDYAKCHYAECRDLYFVMLNVAMLGAVMLTVVAPLAQPGLYSTLYFLHNLRMDPIDCLPFKPSLMFASKAEACPSEAPFRCSTPGRLLVSHTNIILS